MLRGRARRGACIAVVAALACVAWSALSVRTSAATDHGSSGKVVNVRATSVAHTFTAPRPNSRAPIALIVLTAIVLGAWFARSERARRASIWLALHGYVPRRGPPMLLLT
jgi:hypothetical protein